MTPDEIDQAFPTPDPLLSALGRGVRLSDLLNFRWRATQDPYFSDNLGRLLAIAAVQINEDHILRPRHVFSAILHPQLERTQVGKTPTLPKLRDLLIHVAGAGDLDLGHFDFPSEAVLVASTGTAVVGPELVEILLLASWLRQRTNDTYRDAGMRHFIAALVLVDIGRIALDAAGLARPSFAVLRDALVEMIERDAPYYAELGDRPETWRAIAIEMRQTALRHRTAGETHAFTNDRTQIDLLGSSRDATALADLLLLEDLVPPVAVGIFGSWGSGKSTLLRLLQTEIGRRTEGPGKKAGGKVVQINFDAWSHADAENLWASLTAELFDQLTDALDGREADGKLRAGLITEIAKRLHKDTENELLAELAVETQRAVVRDAETTLAKLDQEPVITTVADEMAKDLIGQATPKRLSEDDKKNEAKVREAKEAEDNKHRLEELLQAGGIPKEERDPERLAAFLSGVFSLPSHIALILLLLRRGFVRGLFFGLGTVLALLIITGLGALWYFGWGPIPQLWARLVGALPSLAILGTLMGGLAFATRTVAPILKLAADFLSRKEKRAAELNSKRREAEETVKKEREKLDSIITEQKKASQFAEAYSIAAEGRSREGLLRYFIAFSPELAEVRKRLGLLATVRRCFETLEQIMREKHAAQSPKSENDPHSVADPAKARELAHVPDVRRIIVYIDDLDRCTEQHVVQVLEAIHLLLAFDLFVVVVAVDARWLHRAVGQIYRGQLADPDQPSLSRTATVADYLEKIFQLPFWMQPISNPATVAQFVSGIDSVAPKDLATTQAAEPNDPAPPPSDKTTIRVVDAKAIPPSFKWRLNDVQPCRKQSDARWPPWRCLPANPPVGSNAWSIRIG
ncbi:P-loop NTPase fold protein [Bradyrhizobium sp. RT5a]|uniref:P-loop NTPase fold protein n=1 Tax=unclassified Bradyrhizobium TaxID=2631580 RepID=UPI00339875B1